MEEKKPNPGFNSRFILIGLFLVLVMNYLFLTPLTATVEYPYNQFLQLLNQGKIASVVIGENKISGDLKGPEKAHFNTIAVKDDTLVQKLDQQGVTFRGEQKDPFWSLVAGWGLPLLFFYFLWSFLIRRSMGGSGAGILSMTKSKMKIWVERDVKTTFNDVAGINEAREELQELVRYLKDPKRYAKLGGHAPKGVLLVGPPGTGKTLLARAVAGEAKVPFFSINGSEFVEMFVGLGAARVRDMFEQAKAQVPCIIFIDEIDALGKSRAMSAFAGANDEKEQTLNQLLAEMDGFDSSEGVIMFAATNRPEVLDPALLRAGRFDRQIALSTPDHAGRLQILKVHTKKIKLDPTTDLDRVASATSGFSGADLANLANEAALIATRRNADSVLESDFMEGVERLVAGLEQRAKVMIPLEKRKSAYHELGHATVALGLGVPDRVHKVTIIPRAIGSLGYTMQRPEEDRYLLEESELMNKIAVLLGGRASELVFFKTVTTGSSNDLVKATEIAKAMVMQFGMSRSFGLASYDQRSSRYLKTAFEMAPAQMSEATAREVDTEVKSILNHAFQAALGVIEHHRGFIDRAAVVLLEKESLDEGELMALWQGGASVEKASAGLTTDLKLKGVEEKSFKERI